MNSRDHYLGRPCLPLPRHESLQGEPQGSRKESSTDYVRNPYVCAFPIGAASASCCFSLFLLSHFCMSFSLQQGFTLGNE